MRARTRFASISVAALSATILCPIPAALGGVLTTESFFLPSGPGNPVAAPTMDMILNSSPLSTWGEKGAVGLQGPVNENLATGVSPPAADVSFKFNVGATVDALNKTYGAGNWAISNPQLTFQYTYYANNSIFGGGAGSFETYWVANDSWAFSNKGSEPTSTVGAFKYVAGTDPIFAADATALANWSTGQSDLGSTTYNWLSPQNNPHYNDWSTDKTGPNQGMLTDNLAADPTFLNDVSSATAASNPNVSLYLIPNSSTLGLTIFTGGGNVSPEFSFQVISVPEPASLALMTLATGLLVRPRRRRA